MDRRSVGEFSLGLLGDPARLGLDRKILGELGGLGGGATCVRGGVWLEDLRVGRLRRDMSQSWRLLGSDNTS